MTAANHPACHKLLCWQGLFLRKQACHAADGDTLWDSDPPGSPAPARMPPLARASAPAESVDFVYQAVVGGAPAMSALALHPHRCVDVLGGLLSFFSLCPLAETMDAARLFNVALGACGTYVPYA